MRYKLGDIQLKHVCFLRLKILTKMLVPKPW